MDSKHICIGLASGGTGSPERVFMNPGSFSTDTYYDIILFSRRPFLRAEDV